ncbi:MAG: glyoxalase [Paracoccaceae bacterium]
MQLDHVQLAIPAGSEPECRKFWGGVIGLQELEKPPQLAARGGAWFATGNIEIHLGVDASFIPAKKALPAFVVAEIDTLAARLEKANHPVRWDDAIAGRQRFFTDDPVGNRVEFIAG